MPLPVTLISVFAIVPASTRGFRSEGIAWGFSSRSASAIRVVAVFGTSVMQAKMASRFGAFSVSFSAAFFAAVALRSSLV